MPARGHQTSPAPDVLRARGTSSTDRRVAAPSYGHQVKYAIDLTGFGRYADAAVVAEVAAAAELAGWDGLFIWDHLGWVEGIPSGDPWVSITAAAAATSRIRLGLDVTPLPRRRPQIVATTVAALDRLSNGRITLGVGLGGVAREFEAFGETADPKVRAAMLDEALGIVTQLWSGDRVRHHGRFYTVDDVALAPLPIQRPRPPVWVGGSAPAALRRAASWDGYTAGNIADEQGRIVITPEQLRQRLEIIGPRHDAFDVAVVGQSETGGRELPAEYGQAGATWWLESVHDLRGPLDAMLDRVRQGP